MTGADSFEVIRWAVVLATAVAVSAPFVLAGIAKFFDWQERCREQRDD